MESIATYNNSVQNKPIKPKRTTLMVYFAHVHLVVTNYESFYPITQLGTNNMPICYSESSEQNSCQL